MEPASESATRRRRLCWILAAVLASVVFGPPFLKCFRTARLRDFVQEWAFYFVLQRRWRVVAAGAASIIALTVGTTAVLGIESYRAYIGDVIPGLASWRSSWPNVSLPGFWSKLFAPTSVVGSTMPLVHSPLLARVGTWTSCGLVVAVVVAVVRRARSRSERDHALATCITAMLLVTPIVWDHYFLLLLLPVALLWRSLPTSGLARWDFRLVLSVLWIAPSLWWQIFLGVDRVTWTVAVASPWQTLTALSFQTYGLLGLFALGLVAPRGGNESGEVA